MTVLELSEACQLHQEEEDQETRSRFTQDQVATCHLMVIIQDDKVLLLHHSVKDFLAKTGTPDFNELNAHADLACRCVDLLMDEFHGSKHSAVGFSLYAIHNWARHAGMAESAFRVRDSQPGFFGIDSPYRGQWLDRLRPGNTYFMAPGVFSVLHIAGYWGIVGIVDYVPNRAARINKPGNMVPSINFDCVDLTSATTLEVAVRQGHVTTIERLLDHDVTMGMRVLRAAANNHGNGKEIMTLLLDRRGDQVFITEEVVKAAAGNDGNGKEIMTLLLDRRGDQVSITAEVVSAIAGRFDKETMALLLDRRRYQVSITEEVVNCPGSCSA